MSSLTLRSTTATLLLCSLAIVSQAMSNVQVIYASNSLANKYTVKFCFVEYRSFILDRSELATNETTTRNMAQCFSDGANPEGGIRTRHISNNIAAMLSHHSVTTAVCEGTPRVAIPIAAQPFIQSCDMRVAWSPWKGDAVSATMSYKGYINTVGVPNASQTVPHLSTFRFAPPPSGNYGVKVEIQKNLGFITPALQSLAVRANTTIFKPGITIGITYKLK